MANQPTFAARRAPLSILAVVPLLGLLAVFAAARWTGHLPFGSDNDEYRLVEKSLLHTGRPLVAGVEGTKYPPGYPVALAAFDLLRLPVGWSGLALNLMLVGGAAILVFRAARELASLSAGVIAAAALVGQWSFWLVAGYLTPDVAFAFVVAAAAAILASPSGTGRWAALGGLAFAAGLLRSTGVILGVSAAAAIVFAPPARGRRGALGPLAGSAAAILLQRAMVAGLPVHTTSYSRDLWFRDPYDHALGVLTIGEIPGRCLSRSLLVLRDLGQTLGGATLPVPLATILAVAILLLAIAGFRRHRPFAAAFIVLLLATMLVWPFSGVHFCVPLLPLAAIGIGVAFDGRGRRRAPAGALVAALLLVTAVPGLRYMRRVSASERQTVPVLEEGAADVASWLAANASPGESVASFDYREISLRSGRPVLPISYTSDADALWGMTGGRGARWLVASDLVFPLRGLYADRLVAARPECFVLAHRNPAFRIYRITPRPSGAAAGPA